ncbi:hypothetical protein [Lysobacter enzymogenes]|uniref:hypothetical protein n=1 Tax=Lysobacter enzymogenes TaxID=69 RepID=UPI0011160AA4|nr:hypothetical protein [Lysobacter enzymogenes]UZW60507.1 hypothetical protein BV903_025160 [Lysobacter enzymogenes]
MTAWSGEGARRGTRGARPRSAWLRVAALAWCLAAAPVALADEAERYAPPGAVLSEPRAHPDWPCLASLLQQIVDDQGARGVNALHIGRVVREDDDGNDFVRVYWPRRRAILLVSLNRNGCADPDYRYDSLGLGWYRTKARIDLDHHVRATEAEISGSSFLVTRAWADAVIAECTTHGTELKLRRARRRRRDADADAL